MPYHENNSMGCVLEPPDERDYKYDIIAGGTTDLPKEFVVDVPHFYQNGIDACVGMACAAAKSVQEDKKLSPRFAWHLAKKKQGYLGWGTRISYVMTGMMEVGAIDYGLFDEEVVGVDRDDYMRLDVSEGVEKVAAENKIKSYWRAGYGADIEGAKQAIYEQKIPLITSMTWYNEYNKPKKGFLPRGETRSYGHAFILKGWKQDKYGREYLVFQNSWRKTWGDKGDFYIYTDELEDYNLNSYFVLTDIESDKASVLAKYDGKLIREANKPPHYFVSKGQIAWIKNEASFYFGRDAGFWGDWGDTLEVDADLQSMYDLIF